MIGTIVAHLNNLMKGTKENFVYQLEICNVHFPMTLKVEGDLVKIKSFLGEKIERKARILPNAKVEIKGNKIEVSSYDIEAAGQTAANLEQATKIRNRDRRIFQDGIFITETPKGKI
jgi:large subunit ribosomal protein L6